MTALVIRVVFGSSNKACLAYDGASTV